MTQLTTQSGPPRFFGIEVRTIDDAMKACDIIVKSRISPTHDTPEKVFVAVQHGMELGLSPMQSLQSIAVINGKPALWGDAIPGLVHASGLCEYIKEHIDGEGDKATAICEAKRKDQSIPYIRRFSVAAAKRAGLLGKKGPWSDYPQRMLALRARAWCLRDAFADVLKGLHAAEEVQDYVPAKVVEYTSADKDPLLLTDGGDSITTNDGQPAELIQDPMMEGAANA